MKISVEKSKIAVMTGNFKGLHTDFLGKHTVKRMLTTRTLYKICNLIEKCTIYSFNICVH